MVLCWHILEGNYSSALILFLFLAQRDCSSTVGCEAGGWDELRDLLPVPCHQEEICCRRECEQEDGQGMVSILTMTKFTKTNLKENCNCL